MYRERPSRPNAISMPALEAPSLRDRRRHAEKVGGTACPRAALGHWASIMRSIAVLRFRVLVSAQVMSSRLRTRPSRESCALIAFESQQLYEQLVWVWERQL